MHRSYWQARAAVTLVDHTTALACYAFYNSYLDRLRVVNIYQTNTYSCIRPNLARRISDHRHRHLVPAYPLVTFQLMMIKKGVRPLDAVLAFRVRAVCGGTNEMGPAWRRGVCGTPVCCASRAAYVRRPCIGSGQWTLPPTIGVNMPNAHRCARRAPTPSRLTSPLHSARMHPQPLLKLLIDCTNFPAITVFLWC